MCRKDLPEVFLGHLMQLGALLLRAIGSGLGWLVLGFLAVVIHGTAPAREGFVAAATVERILTIF